MAGNTPPIKQEIESVDIKMEDKKVAANLEIDDRLYSTTNHGCFITIKDHKKQFMNNPKFRLINSCKPELGMVRRCFPRLFLLLK